MNTSTPQTTALIRGLYTAAGSFGVAFLTALTQTDMRGALIIGGITALGALGFRGGIEGRIDTKRAQ